MFEASLVLKFKRIFGVEKVVYDLPGASQEQKCLFVEVQRSDIRFTDGRCKARVEGSAIMFGENEQMPFGFFAKAIARHPDETKDLFFLDFETNAKQFQNIVQRSFSFVYFFDGQYDPAMGTLTSVNFKEST